MAALALCGSIPATAQTITEFPIPTAGSVPSWMAAGPDGAIWFVETAGNKIGRITSAGVVTEYAIPTANSMPQGIVAGPDGAMWFVEGNTNRVGRITTAGVITEFAPPPPPLGFPQSLTVGPDGALWIANQGPMGNGAATGNGWIGRLTTDGVGTNRFPVPTANTMPNFIVSGPDGALWFAYANTNKIGRITTAGVVTEFTVPTPSAGLGTITAGPDGALWFTDPLASKIGRITTSGAVTEFALPANTNPFTIVAGPDGALWFTETGIPGNTAGTFTGGGQKIGRITTSGVITEYAIPTANSNPFGITVGPDGALWFGEASGNRIGRLTLPASFVSQGGLTWSPANGTIYNYAAADAYCRNATFNGLTGWRLPTLAELSGITNPPTGLMTPSTIPSATGGLYTSGAITGMGWTANYLWSSTPTTAPSDNFPGYWGLILVDMVIDAGVQVRAGNLVNGGPLDNGHVTCVQSSAGTATTSVTPSTPLPPPPTTQAAFTASTGRMPTAAVAVDTRSSTFGNATLVVTLDLSKVLAGGSFAGLGQFAAGYSIYVAALAPSGVLGLTSAAWFVLPATRSWTLLGSPIAAYLEGLAQTATNSVEITVLQGLDVTGLVGTEIYIGYGTSSDEMLTAGRYRGIYKVQ